MNIFKDTDKDNICYKFLIYTHEIDSIKLRNGKIERIKLVS